MLFSTCFVRQTGTASRSTAVASKTLLTASMNEAKSPSLRQSPCDVPKLDSWQTSRIS